MELAELTTLRLGGPAGRLVEARTEQDLVEAVRARPALVLAGGSNVVIADAGVPGTVVHVLTRGVERRGDELVVQAGEPWDAVVERCVAEGLQGVECLSGIPGSTGATPIQNVGAYGQEVSETIIRVEVIERYTGRVVTLTNWDCGFGYRDSVFKNAAKDRYIVAGVSFRLKPGGAATIRYPELQKYLDEHDFDVRDLQQVRDAVIAIRQRKGMVLDPFDPDTRSDGSFFMNPIVTPSQFEALLDRAGPLPHFPFGDQIKLSAAWLIEHAGFHKGFVHGNTGLSSKHALAVINRGGATAREVLELVLMIQAGVRERFGVEIQPEPNFVGGGAS